MSGRFKPPGQCPACGEWVPRGVAACDCCGACEKSGWSGDTHADGLDLPDEDFDYDEFVAREFGGDSNARKVGMSPLWWWVAVALLVSLLGMAVMPLFR